MRILCTGGAGYLGSRLVPLLLEAGHHVDVLDSFLHGVPSLAAVGGHPRLTITRGDVRDEAVLEPLVEGADAVVHLAALVGAPSCDAARGEAVSVNYWATTSLISMMRADQPLVFPCTNSGYGKGGIEPCTEDDPMTPLSLYGTTKVRAEAAVLKHALGVSLRFATLYGPSARMRLDLLVNHFVRLAVRDGRIEVYEPTFRRCVLHVSDAARAIASALANAKALAGKPWNVGAENTTKAELCKLIQAHRHDFYWSVAKGFDPDQRDYDVSSDRFREATGWRPEIGLDEGVAGLLRLFRMPFDGPAWRNA